MSIINNSLHEGMASLMEGGHPLVLVIHELAALTAEGDLVAGLLDIMPVNHLLIIAGGDQGALVQKVGQVGPGDSGCIAGRIEEIDVIAQLDLLGMHLEDLLPAVQVGQVDHDLPVEASGA